MACLCQTRGLVRDGDLPGTCTLTPLVAPYFFSLLDIYRVREKKDVFVLKLLKVNLEGSGTARAEFDSEARILAQLQARIHPGTHSWDCGGGTLLSLLRAAR